MQKIIPIYYSDYGRYINRFRAIPSYIDGLIPAERRLLLTLHEVAKTDQKSAKVVGSCLGNYHPHGDTSVYGTLVNLVDMNSKYGFAVGQGNWGAVGLNDDPAAHYRYTEVRLEKWVEDIAFEYINYVPYEEFEVNPEPIYLPCPIPIGLVGRGITTGISFYRTVIPKYKFADLVKRLIWLLEKSKEEIIIQPNSTDCDIEETETGEFKRILTSGIGNLNYSPHGKLEKKLIRILGRAPNSTFVRKKEDEKEGKRKRKALIDCVDKYNVELLDDSKSTIDITVEPKKKGTDLQDLGTKIWSDYLIKKINFNCIFCDNEGKVNTYGIDEILLNNYTLWKYSVKLKRIDDFDKLSNKKVEFMIVQIIRYIFEQYKSTKVDDIITRYHELKKTMDISIEIDKFDIDTDKWFKEVKTITDQDVIDVCNKRTIKNLIETVIDIQKIETELLSARSLIDYNEKKCLDYLKQLK